MLFDIVVVLYNSVRWLDGCVAALAAADFDLTKLNLIFVDNCSTDKTPTKVRELQQKYTGFGGFQLLPQKKNLGFGAGSNRGAAAGSAPAVLFLNADTEVHPRMLTELQKAIDTAEADVAAFECRQAPYEARHHINPVTMETTWASGAALAVRREALIQVGGFDEHFFMYCEDVDLSWMLRAAGYRILYVPRAVVKHYAYEGDKKPQSKLGEYAGGVLGNLMLRYKYGSVKEIFEGHAIYLKTLRRPIHFDHVRKVLAKNYLKHFYKLWPFLFWRLKKRALYKAKPACFTGVYAPDRLMCRQEELVSTPLVSILIRTCAGRQDMLRYTLGSLRHQTYPNFEIVLVEDGPETCRTLAEKEFSDLPIRYFALGEQCGRSRAGNVALEKAKGEYCNFLDDDDYFYPDHLDMMVGVASNHPDVDIVLSSSMAMEADRVSLSPYKLDIKDIYPVAFDRIDVFLFCQRCLVTIQSVMFKKRMFTDYGGMREDLHGNEDWTMWLKYLSKGRRVDEFKVDVPRATSLFVVPADKAAAEARRLQYAVYDGSFLDDPDIVFTLTPRQMRQFYKGIVGDIHHLYNLNEVENYFKAAQDLK